MTCGIPLSTLKYAMSRPINIASIIPYSSPLIPRLRLYRLFPENGAYGTCCSSTSRSFQDCVRSPRGQKPLSDIRWHCPNAPKHFLIMISQSRLRISIWRRQSSDIAVPPLATRMKARRRLNVCVRRRRSTGNDCAHCCPAILLQHKCTQTLRSLGNVWNSVGIADGCDATSS